MPNGFHGAREAWVRLERPSLKLDARLVEFALGSGLSLSKNYHSWPDRLLTTTEGNLRRLIQIDLESEEKLTLNVWICASEDRGDERFWKKQFPRKNVSSEEIEGKLSSILTEALEITRSWMSTDIEFAAKIERHPR